MFVEKITPFYAALIGKNDSLDPLGLMVRASAIEEISLPVEQDDPIGDEPHACAAGKRLIHRYPDRAIFLVTGQCAAHCRFCFRKARKDSFLQDVSDADLADALDYFKKHVALREVIFSGGDPLCLPTSRLAELAGAFKSLRACRVRVHTRFPVYAPARCNDLGPLQGLVDTWALHVNHHREITSEFQRATGILREAAVLLSQTVLLRGVNNSLPELLNLILGLEEAGIMPYYLHVLDRAPGTAGFYVRLEDAVRLIRDLRANLRGRPCPKLMLDLPGGLGKIELNGLPLRTLPNGDYIFRSPLTGKQTVYPGFPQVGS